MAIASQRVLRRTNDWGGSLAVWQAAAVTFVVTSLSLFALFEASSSPVVGAARVAVACGVWVAFVGSVAKLVTRRRRAGRR